MTQPDQATAWIDGARHRFADVKGVLPRLAAVTEMDLPHIVAEDRAYVAAEMTAFLLALLAGAGARIANRPTTQCLCGPAWSDARWRQAAARCGLRSHPRPLRAIFAVDTPDDEGSAPERISVVGGRCVTQAGSPRAEAARRLAGAAGADMLTVAFDVAGAGASVLRADPWVDLDDPPTEQAVLALFDLPAPGQVSAGSRDPV